MNELSNSIIRKYDLSEIVDDILEALDVIHYPFVIFDHNGKFRFANKEFTDLLGYHYHHLSGRKFTDFVYVEDKEFAWDKFKERDNAEELDTPYSIRYVNSEGEPVKVYWQSAYKTKNGYLSQNG